MKPLPSLEWIYWLLHGLLLVLGFLAAYFFMASVFVGGRRRLRMNPGSEPRQPPVLLLRLLRVAVHGPKAEERRQLLLGCGIPMNAYSYELWKRIAILLLLLAGFVGWLSLQRPYLTLYIPGVYIMAAAFLLLLLIYFDRLLLEAIQRQRSHRIVNEIYAISTQLLYYTGSQMNLHSKLSRCLPYTRTIRKEFHLLLNEWYHDADRAVTLFKNRLGTDEAHSFAETIRSLRHNESSAYYELLRQRIADYKERIDLYKESKKETTSYVLFVLAGIPILNTFRLFIYPWVQEGQKLFQTLQ
ncbi:hypothetical protein J2TS4_46470 [Paenibacillus sp. J2TS4]|nr:hypothetical protein J2TS4_46470 [Paenibacillus sp. J2TS4]